MKYSISNIFHCYVGKLLIILALTLLSSSLFAQVVVKDQGFAARGGKSAITLGASSSNKLLESYPSCTVTIYVSGTTSLATIYSDSSLTPKSNPFTATTEGYYEYYAAPGVYDIRFSGTGITTTYTRSGIRLRGGDSTQTVYLADFGAVPDAKESTASINSSDPLHTVYNLASANFTSGMVGDVIYIAGAGPSGNMLKSTITGYLSPTAVTIADAASTSVAGAAVYWGTDNTTPIINAIAYGTSLGAGVVQAAAGSYMVTQIPFTTSTREITFQGISDGANRFGVRGTQFWSAYGTAYNVAPDGIFKTTAPVNSSTPMNITLQNFGIRALDTKNFQACFADVGGTYVNTRHLYALNCHWGIVRDQSELGDDSNGTIESYNEARGASVITGFDPTRQGWTKTGSGTVNVESGVNQYNNEWGGRWQINTLVSADQTNYTYSVPTAIFDKGAVLETKPPETASGGTGSSAVTRIQNSSYRYDIQWQSGGTGSFKVNGGSTISSPTVTLSSIVTIQVFPGGATAQVRVDGNIVITSVAGTAGSYTPTVGFGDFDATNNANTYYQWIRVFGSYPRAAALWYVNGDDWWQSRQSNTYPYGYMRSGYSAVACVNNACNFASVDGGKSVSVAGAGAAGATLTATVSSYVGDGYIWLTSDATDTDTTINVTDTSLFPGSGWFYWGGEASFYTGKTATTLTGVVRGLMGTTAIAHTAVDSHTVSINLYRQFFLSSNASTTVTAANVTYAQASAPEFTNRMSVSQMQFNTTSTELAHDGGYAFTGHESNFNQGSNQVRLGYVVGGSLWSNEHEGMTSDTIIAPQSFLQGRCCGSPFNFAIRDSLINRPALSNAWGMWFRGGSPWNITNNDLVAATGAFILADDTGAVGKITLHSNRTSGAKEISNPFSPYPYVVSDGNTYEYSTPFTGGPAVENYTSLAYRFRTRNIELHYDANVRERGTSGLGSVSATSTAFTASVPLFDASYTGKTIQIDGAGVAGATLTTTVTYVDSTHLTLGSAASTTVSLVNFKVGYSGADAKSSNIRFFDDADAYYLRLYTPTAFSTNQLVQWLDASGTLTPTSGILSNLSWVGVDSSHRLTGNPTFASLDTTTGIGMVRRLNLKAGAASGTNVMSEWQNSSGTSLYYWLYDYTGNWLTLQENIANKQMLTLIPNATYDYVQLHANEGINFAGYSTSHTGDVGFAKFGSNIAEINRGLKTANGGALGDLFARNYRMQLSGASTSVYVTWASTPTGVNTITIPDYAGTGSTLVTSNAALTAGRIPFGVAIGSGVGVTDSANFLWDSTNGLMVATSAAYTSDYGGLQVASSANTLKHTIIGYDTGIGANGAGFIKATFQGTTNVPFLVSPSGQPVGIGASTDPTAQLYITVASASRIGQIIKLAATPSVDAWQLQDSTSTVLAKITKEGYFSAPDGSSANPSITFFNNSNNGFYRPSTNAIGIALNGSGSVGFDATYGIRVGSTQFLAFGGTAATAFSTIDLAIYRNAAGVAEINNGTAGTFRDLKVRAISSTGYVFAFLTGNNGDILYCSDCQITNPCVGGGTGAFAKRLNSVWVCN